MPGGLTRAGQLVLEPHTTGGRAGPSGARTSRGERLGTAISSTPLTYCAVIFSAGVPSGSGGRILTPLGEQHRPVAPVEHAVSSASGEECLPVARAAAAQHDDVRLPLADGLREGGGDAVRPGQHPSGEAEGAMNAATRCDDSASSRASCCWPLPPSSDADAPPRSPNGPGATRPSASWTDYRTKTYSKPWNTRKPATPITTAPGQARRVDSRTASGYASRNRTM